MKIQRHLFVICYLMFVVFAAAAAAEERSAGGGVMTKGDAVKLLSGADFMQKKIGALVSWTIGYDISKVNRAKLVPTIEYVRAMPRKTPPDGRTVVEIFASVDDPEGLGNIAGVRADLSSISRLPNTVLVDNGQFGDEKGNDGVYTLQTNVPPQVDRGAKEVQVAVANKKGWLALAKTTLDVKKNPAIIEARFNPEKVAADGKSVVTLTVKIDNPGRIEDMKKVTVDLKELGYSEVALLRNDGQGGDIGAGDNTFTLQFVVPASVNAGRHPVKIGAANLAGGYGEGEAVLEVE